MSTTSSTSPPTCASLTADYQSWHYDSHGVVRMCIDALLAAADAKRAADEAAHKVASAAARERRNAAVRDVCAYADVILLGVTDADCASDYINGLPKTKSEVITDILRDAAYIVERARSGESFAAAAAAKQANDAAASSELVQAVAASRFESFRTAK
jgi:DNA polymerase III delta prime subunit